MIDAISQCQTSPMQSILGYLLLDFGMAVVWLILVGFMVGIFLLINSAV